MNYSSEEAFWEFADFNLHYQTHACYYSKIEIIISLSKIFYLECKEAIILFNISWVYIYRLTHNHIKNLNISYQTHQQ